MKTISLFPDPNGAHFSECRKYRYALWRIWDERKPSVMFIGLNPSTANETEPDPTIRRVIGFAKQWGYGGVYMCNCFPYISTDPNDLNDFGNTATNDHVLQQVAAKCADIIFAWGAFKVARARGAELALIFPNAKALTINSDGSPMHPLFCPKNIQLVKFSR